ncbi:MAG: hypothetical protein MPN21_00130 [Thermoanaerobaculia bacterium]|nr:hypothetical protein [Thermoanaerobaculia bacterium]
MSKNNGVPAWVWIGCGCGLCILLLIGGAMALGLAGVSFFTRAVDKMADPAMRHEAVVELLGAEGGLPDGYHAHSIFSFPFALKLASLSDGPEPETADGASFEEKAEMMVNMIPRADDLGEHTFIYLEAKSMREDQRIDDILGGERAGGTTSIDLGLEFDFDESLGEGSLEAAGTTVDWRAARGTLGMFSGSTEAQWVAVRFRCGGEVPRAGVWIEHPPGDEPLAELGRLRDFLDHFSPCS